MFISCLKRQSVFFSFDFCSCWFQFQHLSVQCYFCFWPYSRWWPEALRFHVCLCIHVRPGQWHFPTGCCQLHFFSEITNITSRRASRHSVGKHSWNVTCAVDPTSHPPSPSNTSLRYQSLSNCFYNIPSPISNAALLTLSNTDAPAVQHLHTHLESDSLSRAVQHACICDWQKWVC